MKPEYKIVIAYAVFGLLWIYFSDMVIELIDTSLTMRQLQSIKGFIFIVATAFLLFILIRNDIQKIELANRKVVQSYEQTMKGWIQMLDLRSKETGNHTQRVTKMAVRLAQLKGIPEKELWAIEQGALLHDIGKIGIPDTVLTKPGALTEEERAVMQQHPVIARDMMRGIDHLNPAVQIPYSHHERWDGSGYPVGLKGEEIPLAARIFAVADVWDALVHDRVYRKAWKMEDASEYIRKEAGGQFDPDIAALFLEHLPEFADRALGEGSVDTYNEQQ